MTDVAEGRTRRETRIRNSKARLLACVVLVPILACGDDSTTEPDEPGEAPVASVSVDPDSSLLGAIGDTLRLAATARGQDGAPVPGASLEWSSDRPGVASVDPSGLVTARGNGAASITASAGGVEGSAAVRVAQEASSVSIDPQAVFLDRVERSAPLHAHVLDANGNAIADLPITWSSLQPDIATVERTGVTVGRGHGETEIVARAQSVADTVPVVVDFSMIARGRAAPAGGLAIGSMTVQASSEGAEGASSLAADGRFTVELIPPLSADSVTIFIDRAEDSDRAFHPSRVRVPLGALTDSVFVVLVPLDWTIEGGPFAGASVRLSMNEAFRGVRSTPEGCPWLRYIGDPACFPAWPIPEIHWPTFPLDVVFERDSSRLAITAQDSVWFWSALDRVNLRAGEQIFRAAPYPGPGRDGVIYVRAGIAAGEGGQRYVEVDEESGVLRFRRDSFDFRDALTVNQPDLYVRVAWRALGFGTTCLFPSVTCPSESLELTAEDVAYFQAYYAAARLRDELRTRHGISSAIEGERVRMLGLPPLPCSGVRSEPPPNDPEGVLLDCSDDAN